MRVTAAVHRFINYVKQYEKCDPAARRCRLRSGEAKSRFQWETLNGEPDNLSYDISSLKFVKSTTAACYHLCFLNASASAASSPSNFSTGQFSDMGVRVAHS